MNSNRLKIAAAQYDIGQFPRWADYATKLEFWTEAAAAKGARLLVYPEYFSLELASLFPEAVQVSLARQLEALQSLLPDFLELFQSLALRHNVYIVAGTFPVRDARGIYRNRCHLFYPNGQHGFQDKLLMTRFEREHWGISGGEAVQTFDTPFGRIGVNVCYDAEFPLIARRQVEAGATLILVPSCTDTLAGYHRVRIGCQARALENQCCVVQSPTVGIAPWSEAVDINIGAAAVYTPVDRGFPDNGILAIGDLNQPQWVHAEIDLASIERVRNEGQVFNHRDWDEQARVV
ncbi:MAG: carbon-nitrogen hydrolase family protein [Thiotrichales bacterium]